MEDIYKRNRCITCGIEKKDLLSIRVSFKGKEYTVNTCGEECKKIIQEYFSKYSQYSIIYDLMLAAVVVFVLLGFCFFHIYDAPTALLIIVILIGSLDLYIQYPMSYILYPNVVFLLVSSSLKQARAVIEKRSKRSIVYVL